MLLGIVAGSGVLIFPPAFQLVVTRVISDQHHDLRLLWEVVGGVFVVTAIANAASYGQSYLTAWSGQRLIASLRVRLFARVMRLPLGEFDKWRSGEFFSRFTNDLNLMTDAASIALPQMFQTVITFFGALVLLFYTDWLLTLFLFVCAPVVSRVVATFTRLISEGTRRAQQRIADLSANISEALAAERIIKAFSREDFEVAKFTRRQRELFRRLHEGHATGLTQTPVVGQILVIALLVIVAFSAREAIVGRMTQGHVLLFWGYVILTINPINRFATYISDLSKGVVGASRVFEVLDLPTERDDGPDAIAPAHIDGTIRFEHVDFSYGDGEASGADGLDRANRRRRDGRARGAVGRRQDDDGQPRAALLLAAARARHARRRRPRTALAGASARRHRDRAAGGAAVQRQRRRKHPLRPARRDPGRDRSGGAAGQRRRVHPRPAAGLRHAGRRARRAPVGWPAAAHLDRAGGPARPAHPDPGRGDQRARQPLGAR